MEVGVERYWYILDVNDFVDMQHLCIGGALAFPVLVDCVLK